MTLFYLWCHVVIITIIALKIINVCKQKLCKNNTKTFSVSFGLETSCRLSIPVKAFKSVFFMMIVCLFLCFLCFFGFGLHNQDLWSSSHVHMWFAWIRINQSRDVGERERPNRIVSVNEFSNPGFGVQNIFCSALILLPSSHPVNLSKEIVCRLRVFV